MDFGDGQVGEEARMTSFGLTLSNDMVATLEAYVRIAALGIGSLLDENFRHRFSLGLEDASVRSVFFTSRPITAGSVKALVQLVVLVFGGIYFYAMITIAIRAHTFPPYAHYRYTNLVSRENTPPHTPGVLAFGLLDESGCSPGHSLGGGGLGGAEYAQIDQNGTRIVLSLTKPIVTPGWYLTLAPGMEGSQFFEIEGSNFNLDASATPEERERAYNEAQWDFLLSPVMSISSMDIRSTRLVTVRWPGMFVLPEVQEVHNFVFDWEDHWSSWFMQIRSGLKGIACVLYAFLGGLRRPTLARAAIASLWTASIVLQGVPFLWQAVYGAIHAAVEMAMRVVPDVFVASAAIFERHAFLLLLCSSALDILIRNIFAYLYGADAQSSAFGIVLLCMLAVLWGTRKWALRESLQMMRVDQERYDVLWREEVARDAGAGCIAHLEKVVAMLGILPTDSCKQHTRILAGRLKDFHRVSAATRLQPPNALFDSIGKDYMPVPCTQDPKGMTESIDQLYAQASVSNVLLCDLVKKWAAASNGAFPLQSENEHSYVKWSDAQYDEALRGGIKWPTLKKHRRAIEKLLRVYENDVSRLVDLSRHCIIFQSVSDLTLGLGQIVTDEKVVIERVKNRLSTSYDAAETAGYRDVAINFRIMCPESIAIGSETHVCEVQLVLASFFELKSSQGHARYVAFRNVRGT